MPTIRITDKDADGCLALDLADLLAFVGDAAAKSSWSCKVEAIVPKPGTKYVDWALAGEHTYDGAVLFQLASNTLQTHDGMFKAFRPGEDAPWLVLEAFDTTWWEVSCQDVDVLDSIRSNYRSVEDRGGEESAGG